MKFDLNRQRGTAFILGVLGLVSQQALTALEIRTSDVITGAFLVMVVGPFVGTVAEKYQDLLSRRSGDKGESS